ncbi:MAG: hypothetical protein HW383_30 [Candidatus Magasanikbacteria bacterium]|nr:hypothetical protein [Candidatus Magasanikbacteria bacterium]
MVKGSTVRGFTLIELIIVMAILAVLALIVFNGIDPQRRIHAANNTVRAVNINSILNAYLTYIADNRGAHVTSTSSGTTYMIGQIGGSTSGCTASSTSDIVVLTGLVDTYITSIPYDPVNGNSNSTKYYYYKSPNGRVTIGGCTPESEGTTTPVISVSR